MKARVFSVVACVMLWSWHVMSADSALPRLVVRGQFFALENGQPWTAIEATDFNLLGRFVANEDITPILRQRAAVGFNLVRVFVDYDVCADGKCPPSNQAIGRLVPSEHPNFHTQLKAFLELCARHRLYVELVVLTGRPDSNDARVALWDSVIATVAPTTNVILELVNEWDQSWHRNLPFERFRRPPPPILASRGSGMAGSPPRLPLWTHATYHPGFGPEWTRMAIHDGMATVAEKHGVPVLVNETTRFPDNESSATRAYDVARGCALLVAGCAFHSVAGKNSRLWEGRELTAAREWARGATSVPLSCQRGAFRRVHDPAFLQVYERTSDNSSCRAELRR
jgi:hypothetical protein